MKVSHIWRYPIKSHGAEALEAVTLSKGAVLPYDRLWAIAHEQSDVDGAEWAPCQHFSRGSKAPLLSAISSKLDETTEMVTLSHPQRDDVTLHPDKDAEQLLAWAGGFIPENRADSARVVRGAAHGFTDSDFQSVTLGNLASHRAVEQKVGTPLSPLRWRGNIFFDGGAPWEEFDWMDQEVQVGEAVLRLRERTDRCLATHNNPETGIRDANILAALDTWGHRDFTVRTEVVRGGQVAIGDEVTPL